MKFQREAERRVYNMHLKDILSNWLSCENGLK